MNYWLLITTPDNWEVTQKRNTIGVAERYKKAISRLHKGDKCLIYIKQGHKQQLSEPSVSGEFEVVSDLYVDTLQIFKTSSAAPNETFPLRIKLRRLTEPTKPIAFKPLIQKLSFIKNKQYWGGTLQGNALLNIPEQDYATIASLL